PVLGGLTLRAGIVNARGDYALVELGDLDNLDTQWQEVRGDLKLVSILPIEPLTLVLLVVTGTSTRAGGPSLFLDDVSATGGDGRAVILENFDGAPAWSRFPSVAPVQDEFEMTTEQPRSGTTSARIGVRANVQDEVRGIYMSGFLTTLPVIVSESFLAASGATTGSTVLLRAGGVLVPTVVRATFELFPTTVSHDGPVVVFDRDRLLYWLDVGDPGYSLSTEPSEIWLSVAEGADLGPLEEALGRDPFRLDQFVSRQQALDAATRNPLIAASGSGILLAAFVAVMGLVAAALLTSLLAAVRRRRVEFAVVQAIGLTKRQLLAMLALEYAVVFAMGIGAGVVMGMFVSDQMLSFLDVTETGDRIEPSFILQTQWLIVGLGVGLVAAVFSAALWLASRSVGRGTEAAALRTE
ncbi:MAG: ABC transporter permease, partial [Dehalococcoidia bacterium]|nr:ABC transporter permease [Dehalococcoidia bacterium]